MMRTLLVDDEQLIRVSFSCILANETDIDIVAEAATGLEAVTKLKALSPDIVILDLGLPDVQAFSLVQEMLAIHPELKILVLTACVEQKLPELLFNAGVMGLIAKKDANPEYLVASIRSVKAGNYVFGPGIESRYRIPPRQG